MLNHPAKRVLTYTAAKRHTNTINCSLVHFFRNSTSSRRRKENPVRLSSRLQLHHSMLRLSASLIETITASS
jgi:hypothetical protein